jgi:ethanolamine utilization protein EutQ (cupin superfamily)
VITDEEIRSMPRMEFNTGIETAIFISRERDDARYFRQGVCYAEPDFEPVHWEQLNFDETQYCLAGKVRLRIADRSGRGAVLEIGPGEHIYLPAGYIYTLEPSGVETTFLWTSGPSNKPGIVENPEYSKVLKQLRREEASWAS